MLSEGCQGVGLCAIVWPADTGMSINTDAANAVRVLHDLVIVSSSIG